MHSANARYLVSEHITFKYAKGVSERSGTEFHAYHELIWLIGGQARFVSDKLNAALAPDTLIVIPTEHYHQVLITGPQEAYHRCTLHFLHVPGLEDLIRRSTGSVRLLDMTPRLLDLFRQMIEQTANNDSSDTRAAVIQAALTLILLELSVSGAPPVPLHATGSLSEKCIEYIHGRIGQPLSNQGIAKALNVSESYLAHAFKSRMHISLHQYILKKRLTMARHRILDGEPAVQAAMACGFQDYSGFYKQYRKMFHNSPTGRQSGGTRIDF